MKIKVDQSQKKLPKKTPSKTDAYTYRLSNQPQTGFHESFRTSNEFFHQLLESLEDYAIFSTDIEGNISSWNSGAKKILGYKEKEIIGQNFSILYTPQDTKKNVPGQQLKKALKASKFTSERWHMRKDKTLFWGSGLVFPLYDSYKKVRGFTIIMRNLTERKLARDQEKRFQSVIENSSDGIRLIDIKGNIMYASPSTKRILGYKPSEYLNHKILELIHPEDRKKYRDSLLRAIKSPGKPDYLEYRIRHKNGQYRWMEGVGTNLLQDPTVNAIVSNFRDITDRKNAEEEKERILKQFTTVLEKLPAGVVIADAVAGKFVLINSEMKKILREKNIHAKSFTEYKKYKRYFPDDREYKPEDWPLCRAIKNGETVSNEEIRIRRGDGTIGYISVGAAPIKDKDGKIISGVSTCIDITEKKDMERRKDEFISLASHELKTPVTSLNLFADMLRKCAQKNDYDRVPVFIDKIKQQSSKLSELINDFLDVSRIETGKLRFRTETFELNQLLCDIVEDMQYTTAHHTIICKVKAKLLIHADRYRIYQVLTNLLTNAIKYSPKGTQITVNATIKNDFVKVSVADKGIGVTKDQQKKIFDKLYQIGQSKEKTFPGLGMGLYISKEIVMRHGGKIWVSSKSTKDQTQKNPGSTFYFTLPLAK